MKAVKQYYQDGERERVQRGNDSLDRPILNESQRNLVRVISDIIDEKETKCKDHCPISPELKPHINHMVGIVKDFGNGKIEPGLNKWGKQLERTRRMFEWWDSGTSITFKVIVFTVVTGVIALIGLGFWQK